MTDRELKSSTVSSRKMPANPAVNKMIRWVSLCFVITFLNALLIVSVFGKPQPTSSIDNFKDNHHELQASEAGYGLQGVALRPPVTAARAAVHQPYNGQRPQTVTLTAHKSPQSSYYYSDYYVPQEPPKKFLPPPQSCPETGRTVCREVKPNYPTDEVFDIVMQIRAKKFNITSEFINDSEFDDTPNLPQEEQKKLPQAKGYIVYQTSIHYDPHAPQQPQHPQNYGQSYQYITNSSLYSNFLGKAQRSSIPSVGSLRIPPPSHPQETTKKPDIAPGDSNGLDEEKDEDVSPQKEGQTKGGRKAAAPKRPGKVPPAPGQKRPRAKSQPQPQPQPQAPPQPQFQQQHQQGYEGNDQYNQNQYQSLEAPPQYNQQQYQQGPPAHMTRFQATDAITGGPRPQQAPQQGYGYGGPSQEPITAPSPRAPLGPAAPQQHGPQFQQQAPQQYGPQLQQQSPYQQGFQQGFQQGVQQAPRPMAPPQLQVPPPQTQYQPPYQGQAPFQAQINAPPQFGPRPQNPPVFGPQLPQQRPGQFAFDQRSPVNDYQGQIKDNNYAASQGQAYHGPPLSSDYMPGIAEQSFRSPQSQPAMLDAFSESDSMLNPHGGRYKRQADDDEPQELCETRTMFITPRAALNDRSQWKYVVNVPERDQRFRQVIRVDVCSNPGGSCANTVSSNLPFGQSSRCTQKYIKKKLLAIDEDGQGTSAENFFVPSCCVCQIISNRRK